MQTELAEFGVDALKQESNKQKKKKRKPGIHKALKLNNRLIKHIGERFTRKLQFAKFYLFYHKHSSISEILFR